jgi:hypothetical protein
LQTAFVAAFEGAQNFFDGGAHTGTLAGVAGAGFFGLSDAFFCLCCVSQCISPDWNPGVFEGADNAVFWLCCQCVSQFWGVLDLGDCFPSARLG